MAKKNVDFSKNCPHWIPTEDDYVLAFFLVDGMWRECSHNLPKYADMLLSDYLGSLGLCVPDYTQFLRICAPDYNLEYRSFGGRVRIDFKSGSYDAVYGY